MKDRAGLKRDNISADQVTIELMQSLTEPYMAQEFIDSSSGIPGLTNGMHDLRMIMFNNEPKFSFVRQPKTGSFLANTAQGGSLFYINPDQIPAAALALAKEIDAQFSDFIPRLYAIDVMFQNDQVYLVELNDQPGMAEPDEEQFNHSYTRYQQALFEILAYGLALHT